MSDGEAPAAEPRRSTGRVALVIFAGILLLLGLYLLGDRNTPHSNQARVSAYVVAIAPEVGGTVSKVHVRNDQLVRKGQPLYTIGADQFQIARTRAEADVEATRRELAAQDAAVSVAAANVSAAQAELVRSRQDSVRLQRIQAEDRGAISQRRVEMAVANLRAAESRLRATEAQLVQAQAARGARGQSNDRLVAARSALEKADLDLRRTTVVAPGDGIVTDLAAEAGQFAGAGSAVVTFISLKDAWIIADMTENNLGNMQPGDAAEFVLDVQPGRVLQGRVRSIGFGVSTGRNQPGALPEIRNDRDFLRQAQRFPVIIEFDPKALESLRLLRQGGQAEVIVYTGDNPLLNALGRLYIRAVSLLSYAY